MTVLRRQLHKIPHKMSHRVCHLILGAPQVLLLQRKALNTMAAKRKRNPARNKWIAIQETHLLDFTHPNHFPRPRKVIALSQVYLTTLGGNVT